ncbi:MAG: hypothetical protein GXN93_01790 [Candidatus Diapherotrites archaeon]|nr:hypothetical protein [Candidatus Diapherotrites archaeon]
MDDRIGKALEFFRRLKHVPMEMENREKWMWEWRKRTAEQILKEKTVWGCRDVALVMKHIMGNDARIVEGVRILKPGGHVWVQVDGENYNSSGDSIQYYPNMVRMWSQGLGWRKRSCGRLG